VFGLGHSDRLRRRNAITERVTWCLARGRRGTGWSDPPAKPASLQPSNDSYALTPSEDLELGRQPVALDVLDDAVPVADPVLGVLLFP
jgi:hypothetical protein